MSETRRLAKNLAFRIADMIATFVPLRQRHFSRPKAIYILMLKPLGLGDLMMLSPFFIEVARRFDDAQTYLVTEHVQFMDLLGVAWTTPTELLVSIRKQSLVISPTLSWRHMEFLVGAEHFLGFFFSNRLTCSFHPIHQRYDARNEHYFERAEHLLSALEPRLLGATAFRYGTLRPSPAIAIEQIKNYVCIAPYSNWAERQYPRDSFAAVIKALAKVCPVVLVGGNHPDEIQMAESFSSSGVTNLVGKTSFAQATDIIMKASLFIGNDSGLAHAAFLARTPSIVIFGCVPGNQRIPIDRHLSVRITALGAGERCSRFPCYDGFNKPNCKNVDRFICLRGVSHTEVIGHAIRVLDENASPTATGSG